MSPLIESIRRAKASGDWTALFEAIPYARFLGLTLAEDGGELVSRMKFGDHLVGNPTLPALHGGTLAALLESAAIFQLFYEAETVVLPKTITITVDYLRPARPRDTFARGIVTRHGRRVANVRVEAWQDDRAKPVAIATAHLLIKAEDA